MLSLRMSRFISYARLSITAVPPKLEIENTSQDARVIWLTSAIDSTTASASDKIANLQTCIYTRAKTSKDETET